MPIDIKRYAEQWLKDEELVYFLKENKNLDDRARFLVRKFALAAALRGFEGYETLENTKDEELIEVPTLSIIMLTYNALEYTKKAIASIQAHTRIGYELIIIDNKSTDGTRAWLKKQKG